MNKQCVKWKSIQRTNTAGKKFDDEMPEIVDRRYRGRLISIILSMPKKKPISFELAIERLAEAQSDCFKARRIGHDFGQYHWYASHFVEWISELGYHIELSGDEFEPHATTKMAC
jgi:hypothetical protein